VFKRLFQRLPYRFRLIEAGEILRDPTGLGIRDKCLIWKTDPIRIQETCGTWQ